MDNRSKVRQDGLLGEDLSRFSPRNQSNGRTYVPLIDVNKMGRPEGTDLWN
jgi:hypothetical protein